ncbi:MAG: type 2 isopentenyl-diphosphate Delta-isomerase [Bacillati bacterium ANGP1]|uniref:Isopentenyl-diphosphate delta-isomerase n=1 Tax=Candidatus Segetimicrobium genomatis TaxID=2569760 RepID=A0A537JIW2_9BACT|nr:MAG: type 2 isopentenyl-diphosphate Delta-isomerase [Terrabacteria group bacterium ANGP1]
MPPRAAPGGRNAPPAADVVERRKAEHLRVVATGDVAGRTGPGWSDIHLVHHALPVTDLPAVDLSTVFLGHRLRAPLVVAAMTGGHDSAGKVNAILAGAAERHGVAMGLGSQRAALHNPRLARTYAVARESAPSAFLIANIGAAQLVPQDSGPPLTPDQVSEAVAMIRADALAIHFNFLEEIVQPEGDRRATGLREAIAGVVASIGVPAIAKETGAGLSRQAAQELRRLGVRALDVGGLGGTSFAAVETIRAQARGDIRGAALGTVYRDWGIPTAVSVVAARAAGLPIIATGGIRTGLDAAKAIALGASLVGIARPLLVAALKGPAAVEAWIGQFLEELRAAVFLTGGKRVDDLRSVPRAIVGDTRRWVDALEG